MKVFTIVVLITTTTPVIADQWRRVPDSNRWEYVSPGYGQWKREPTGNKWQWVTPDDDWRRDPNGRWQVVPKGE